MCTWERHCHVWTIFYGNHIRTALESDEGRIKGESEGNHIRTALESDEGRIKVRVRRFANE